MKVSKYLEPDIIKDGSIDGNKIKNYPPLEKGSGEGSVQQIRCTASGHRSFAEGDGTIASGVRSHAEGSGPKASGDSSHAEGFYTTASGGSSHAEGFFTTASSDSSHTEGRNTKASGDSSHAEGYSTTAEGDYSHAEGSSTTAEGDYSHAEGSSTTAEGDYSHVEGYYTYAYNQYEHAEGKYNKSIKDKTIHTIGIGAYHTEKNAHEIHLDGKHYIIGIGGYNGMNSGVEGIKTLQEVVDEVDTKVTSLEAKNTELTNTIAKLEPRVTNAVQVTYSELKSLRDAGKLVPGAQYRVTDYTCTTIQENTRSAGHPFDIIVTADDENTLNEEARATLHTGDDYFSDCNLSAWKIWYCLDNDIDRFAWSDEENGKGVIYRMIDEWNNDVPYDFKNIQFKRYAVTDVTSTKLTSDALNELKNILVKNSNGGLYFATKDCYGNFVPSDADGTSYEINGNDSNWYYTFQGISSDDGSTINKMYDLTVETFKLTNECISYLEGDSSGADTEDYCRENKIEQLNQEYFGDDIYYKGRQILNNIVFIGGLNYCYYNEEGSYWEYNTSSIYGNRFGVNCNSNTFGNNCWNNTFGNYCYSNTFGNNCSRNTFGNDCCSNTFGNYCYNNTFGNNCWNNTFGNDCYNNTFGNSFQANTFGNRFQANTFGNNCFSNTFGNSFQANTFGNSFQANTFGNYCYSNTFGNNCYSNTFGNNCYNNTFGNNCFSNTFGNSFQANTFGNSFQANTFGNYCNYNSFGDNCNYIKFTLNISASTKYNYYQNNHFGDGCQYIIFKGAETASPSAQVQNYNFAQGLQGTSSAYLTIDGVRNLSYETKVAKNSNGEIKTYCEADLIL